MIKQVIIVSCLIILGCKGVSQEKEVASQADTQKETKFRINKTEAQWKSELTDMQFYVLRKAGTENPGSSELLHNEAIGTYVCAACATPLFRSENKFDSGTGWPSFDRAITGNVAYEVDHKTVYERNEEHCAVCGGHLGHVFNDGPAATTGKRHCINGAALEFIPD